MFDNGHLPHQSDDGRASPDDRPYRSESFSSSRGANRARWFDNTSMREDIDFSAVDLHLAPREPGKKRRILGSLGYLYVGTKWFITKLFVIRSGEP